MFDSVGVAFGSLVLASGGPWGDDGWDGGWLLARLAFTVLWIVIVFAIVRFVIFGRFGRGRGRWGPSPMERARGVLAERYARGEIDAEEYRARSETLKES